MADPRVSVVIPAYNMAEYVGATVDSALAQENVGGGFEVIVVDDGSTDRTPEVLSAYGDRISVVRRENGGQEAAVRTGFELVRGQYVAMLDADDVWLPDRLARHVELLDQRPEVGLTYSDAEIIGSDGGAIAASYFARYRIMPAEGRLLGRVIRQNFVGASGITLRASLIPAVLPGLEHAAYADWGVVAGVLTVAEIARVPGATYRYRMHAANRLFGSETSQELRNELRNLHWYRWLIDNAIDDSSIHPEDVRFFMTRCLDCARTIASASDEELRHTGMAANIGDSHPDQALRCLAETAERGRPAQKGRAVLRAFSLDPLNPRVIDALRASQEIESRFVPTPLLPALGATELRERVLLLSARDVLAEPSLLDRFAQQDLQAGETTIVILVDHVPEIRALARLVASSAIALDDDFDAVIVHRPLTAPGHAWLQARASGWLVSSERAAAKLPV